MSDDQEKKDEPVIVMRYQGKSNRGNWIPMIPRRNLTQEMLDHAVEIYPEFEKVADVVKYCEKSKLYTPTRALGK
jgi:hypothetical protein